MKRIILTLTLLALPLLAQKTRVDNMKAFQRDLATAVQNGNLSADEKAKYDGALKKLAEIRTAKKAGNKAERGANREAMQDLIAVAKSTNLKEEDRATLAKHIDGAKAKGKGKRGKKNAQAQ
ncbi:MAG: hypothetical protein FJW32_26125 [Acidobacteria bacterium]|nr:hypothetical protein [Acidobacteriota bacterium]